MTRPRPLWLILLLLLCAPLTLHAGGITVEPGPATNSPDGSASGGYAQGTALGGLYNPSTGTGIKADPNAPIAAQNLGLNSGTSALGLLWGLMSRPPVRQAFLNFRAPDFFRF